MTGLLWLIPVLPFAGFLILILAGPKMPRKVVALVGAGSVGVSAVLALLVGISFISSPPAGHAYSQTLWTWLQVAGLRSEITFMLDPLSLVMTLVITFVGFLIHMYSVEYMKGEERYSRFFAFMNLFVGFMLLLVLADNLVLLYLGWEGVGICSYLLIGFWYRDPANGYAARKAFIVTRIGDVALIIGLFLLYSNTGTLQIQDIMRHANLHWQPGSALAAAAAFLLLGGAIGKSAQVPLQTWLPDAMAGPTPVSALIHAATMVTAGVYLIARTDPIFALAPAARLAVAAIGAATLLIAGFSALVQSDIKRVLAYSTISQIGYMFLALGVGAWPAAIFHFMVHAFFKSLLFLGAGVVIDSFDHERNMFRMGGLRMQLPVLFWTFLAGAASLSAIPLVTAGFYSKDLILWESLTSPSGGTWLWGAGLAGAFITSLYTFRMVFLTFFGRPSALIRNRPSAVIYIPLVVLAVLSVISGYPAMSSTPGGTSIFYSFFGGSIPATVSFPNAGREFILKCCGAAASLSGLCFAWIFFLKNPGLAEGITGTRAGALLNRFWFSGWGFDWLYDTLVVRPFLWMTRLNREDFIDLVYSGIGWYAELAHGMLASTQSGNVRWYAAAIALGAVLMIVLVVFT